MGSPASVTRYLYNRWHATALALAYLLVGFGLAWGVATDTIDVILAALIGVLGLIALSLAIIIKREGLVTPENKIIAGLVVLAMLLLFGLDASTALASELVFGIVFTVGVIVPHLLLEYTDIARPTE